MNSKERELKSVDIFPFTRNNFNALTESTPPWWILFNNDKKGIGNSTSDNLYACNEMYLKCKAYRMSNVEYGGLPCG